MSTHVSLAIREALNSAIFGLFICLAWRFWAIRQSTDRYQEPRLHDAATALTALCIGEVLRAALVWLSLSVQAEKWPRVATWADRASPGWIVAGLVIFMAGLCCIRSFPEAGDPKRTMRYTLALVIACVIVSVST